MSLPLAEAIRRIPKVELHVHLEGSIRPETLLKLARRHDVALPAADIDGLRRFYKFTSFPHFVEIYVLISSCLRTPDDIELIAREFLAGQAAQNIVHSEVTYTAYTIYKLSGISIADQLAALSRARAWAEKTLGVTMSLIFDIAREVSTDEGLITADFAIAGQPHGVIALGIGGDESRHPPSKHAPAFARARAAGLRSLPHAGEIAGPTSIYGALRDLFAERLGHGVRCLEDDALVAELVQRQVPLEVCPTSNVCLGVAASLEEHPLPQLLSRGLFVTLNSDDPPLFNTTLTDEYIRCAQAFSWDARTVAQLAENAVAAAYLPAPRKVELTAQIQQILAMTER
jgi:aminodeoxyfutalosine deaminase